MRPKDIAIDEASRRPGAATLASARRSDVHLLGPFLAGAAAGPAAIAIAGLWLTLAPPPPCGTSFLCFRGLGEALISVLVFSLGAGVVAQVLARDVAGWLALVGGILVAALAFALLAPPPGGADKGFVIVTVLLGVPATAGYAVAAGSAWLWRHAP